MALDPYLALTALLVASAGDHRSADDGLAPLLDQLVREGTLGHSHAGVEVFSLEDSRLVYALRPDELLNPASNTKLFTSAAALYWLGADYRFLTEFLVDDNADHGLVQGNLYVRGRGDPSLISERVWQIANELWHLGLREVKGDLVLDDSYFDAVTEGPGWEQDKSDRAYMAPISALAVNWSSVGIYLTPGAVGEHAKIELEPDSHYFKIENRVTTGPPSRKPHKPQTSGRQTRDGYRLTIAGRIPLGQPTMTLWRRVGDPTLYAGETIKELLSRRGIKIRGKVRRGLVPATGAALFFTAESDSLDILLKRLNKQSSNFVAEMLVKTMGVHGSGGPGSWATGMQAIADFLQREVGLRKGSYLMKNGSGLNDVNRFSAAQVVRLLAYMYPKLTLAPEYVSSLGIAGKDGTVRFRMGGTAAAGRVRAKTGTLEDVTALSGYTETLGGRHYAFSILVNDFPDTLHQAILAEDAFAVTLSGFGAPPPGLAAATAPDAAARSLAAADGFAAALRPEPAEGLPSPEDRLARYGALAAARDPANAPYLRLAVQNERAADLRAVAAEALYRSEPDEGEAVEALLEVLPNDPGAFEAQRRAARTAGIAAILWEAFVDLASDGEGRGLAGLLALAKFSNVLPVETAVTSGAASGGKKMTGSEEGEDGEAPDDRRRRAAGLVEVARQVPRQLLEAMAASPAGERDPARSLLIFGLSNDPEAAALFAPAVGDLAGANPSPAQQFAAELQRELNAGRRP